MNQKFIRQVSFLLFLSILFKSRSVRNSGSCIGLFFPYFRIIFQFCENLRREEKKLTKLGLSDMSKTAGPNGDVSSPGSIDSDVSEDTTWISWFTQLKGNEFFCEVDEEFIQDDFNLTGLSSQVTYYNYALDTILDVDIPEGELDDRQQEMVEISAETLYGLIHARYILTARGMDAMRTKYLEGNFGRCPRVYCKGQPVLPVGVSDLPRCSTVKTFCPMCWDLFFPRARGHNNLDGAFWGTTFAHIFLHTYHALVPPRNRDRYVPRIYGFKIHSSAIQVQRNLNPPDSPNDEDANMLNDSSNSRLHRHLSTRSPPALPQVTPPKQQAS